MFYLISYQLILFTGPAAPISKREIIKLARELISSASNKACFSIVENGQDCAREFTNNSIGALFGSSENQNTFS